jgi:hypothetical protein
MGASATPGTSSSTGEAGLGDGVKQQASELASTAQEKVQAQLDHQKERATDALGGVSDALRQVGGTLRESDQDAFARYAETAAEQLEAFTRSLRNRSVGELLDEAERFARREPALFVGGAFLLGVLGARFLKASAPDRVDRGRGPGNGYASGYGAGYGPGSRPAYGPGYGSSYGPGRYAPQRAGAYGGTPGGRYDQPPHRVLHTAGGEMPDPSSPSNPARTPNT